MPETEHRGIKIKELVERTGVTKATIYHYVREGLLPKPIKTSRNMALYDPDCIERILLVKGLQKHHRRSLAEVKSMLEGASGHEGLERLRRVLESDATRSQASPLKVESRTALSAADLRERTGFSEEVMRKLETAGILTATGKRGKRIYDPLDVDVADALSRLARAGFDHDSGFEPQDVVIYLDALRDLLQKEVALFFQRVGEGGRDTGSMLARAERGIELSTPLLLAMRRKLLRELLNAASLPKE